MPFENAYSGFTLKGAGEKEAAVPRVAVADISPKDFFKRCGVAWRNDLAASCRKMIVEGLVRDAPEALTSESVFTPGSWLRGGPASSQVSSKAATSPRGAMRT